KYAQATEHFKMAIADKKQLFEAWYNLALTYEKLEKPDKAENCYLKALEIQPENARLLINFGMFLYEKGNSSRAYIFLLRATEADDDRAYPLVALGYYYQLEKQPEKALAMYEKAVRIEPDYALTYYRLGFFHEEKSEIEKAKNFYRQAVKFDPEDSIAAERYAWVLVKLGLVANAISAFEKVIELEDDYLPAYLELAKLYQSSNLHEEAIITLWEARTIEPDETEIARLLIKSYNALVKKEILDANKSKTADNTSTDND
ncbi:MAG: tetratricopeptide repeat protein, partial [Planctomycetes bacterium]|nr:tetratricopeptide repeat protein [Planctomycetota bacterium]